MKKLQVEKIQKIYSIVIGVFVVAMGIAIVCVAADIYYSGQGTDVLFSRENVGERLQMLAIPLILLIGAIALGAVFPAYNMTAKYHTEDALHIILEKPASCEDVKYRATEQEYKKLTNAKYIVMGIKVCALLGCTIAELCYLLNAANFSGTDITAEMLSMTKNVLPFILITFVVLIAATIGNAVISRRQLNTLKTLIKFGNGITQDNCEIHGITRIKQFFASDVILIVIRVIVLVVGVTFIILGTVNGGAHDVLVKAINICTECIGLG